MTDERLERLERERDNHTRNARAWRLQADRIRRDGRDPGDLLTSIVDAEREANRLADEILGLQDADRHERQRRARLEHADQAVRLGKSLPDKDKDKE